MQVKLTHIRIKNKEKPFIEQDKQQEAIDWDYYYNSSLESEKNADYNLNGRDHN